MKIFDNLLRSIRRQPDVLGGWLRDHLARIAPSDGSAEPTLEEMNRLLQELDTWTWTLYRDESDSTLWRNALKRWRVQSSDQAVAAMRARFADRNWILLAIEHLRATGGNDGGKGLGLLHYEFVRLGLIEGPPVVTVKVKVKTVWLAN